MHSFLWVHHNENQVDLFWKILLTEEKKKKRQEKKGTITKGGILLWCLRSVFIPHLPFYTFCVDKISGRALILAFSERKIMWHARQEQLSSFRTEVTC